MPYSPRISILERALILLVVLTAAILFVESYLPILSLIVDGSKLAFALINGDAAAIGSLIK